MAAKAESVGCCDGKECREAAMNVCPTCDGSFCDECRSDHDCRPVAY